MPNTRPILSDLVASTDAWTAWKLDDLRAAVDAENLDHAEEIAYELVVAHAHCRMTRCDACYLVDEVSVEAHEADRALAGERS